MAGAIESTNNEHSMSQSSANVNLDKPNFLRYTQTEFLLPMPGWWNGIHA